MNKKTSLLGLSLLFTLFVFAQENESIEIEKIGKYTIKVTANTDSTYGYEIHEDNNLIVKQTQKPFFSRSSGFSEKKNAMVVARWFVSEMKQGRNNKYALGIQKAKELGVSENELIFK